MYVAEAVHGSSLTHHVLHETDVRIGQAFSRHVVVNAVYTESIASGRDDRDSGIESAVGLFLHQRSSAVLTDAQIWYYADVASAWHITSTLFLPSIRRNQETSASLTRRPKSCKFGHTQPKLVRIFMHLVLLEGKSPRGLGNNKLELPVEQGDDSITGIDSKCPKLRECGKCAIG